MEGNVSVLAAVVPAISLGITMLVMLAAGLIYGVRLGSSVKSVDKRLERIEEYFQIVPKHTTKGP